MARLYFSGLLGNGRVDVPIVGEGGEPDKEAALSTSLTLLDGRLLTGKDVHGALVGEGLAKTLNVRPGDSVTLLASTLEGAMNTADLEVVGVFRSFSKDYDARALKVSLTAAQELLSTPDANTIVVQLARTADTRRIAGALSEQLRPDDLVVKTWDELNDFYANTVLLYDRQFAVLRLIILFLVVLGVANTVNMTVFERLAEFGTMRALGNRGGPGDEPDPDRMSGFGSRGRKRWSRARDSHRPGDLGDRHPDAAAAEFERGLYGADRAFFRRSARSSARRRSCGRALWRPSRHPRAARRHRRGSAPSGLAEGQRRRLGALAAVACCDLPEFDGAGRSSARASTGGIGGSGLLAGPHSKKPLQAYERTM